MGDSMRHEQHEYSSRILVLAKGTARNNRTTGWSVESLHKYAGITRERGQAAVTHLINSGLLRHGANHIRAKPRYELTSPGELAAERYRASLAAISDEDRVMMNYLRAPNTKIPFRKAAQASIKRLMVAGLVREAGYHGRIPSGAAKDGGERPA
jgi:hypothetical protein